MQIVDRCLELKNSEGIQKGFKNFLGSGYIFKMRPSVKKRLSIVIIHTVEGYLIEGLGC